ncbi:MAG TPA: LuxR C-terminal-related transcriptional regulator [Candidatus Baltobacteraceae bacterium]|jgi:ATP/maltotriose-dependent transcriptional regulator MalT|nr:LuxR C-terminal-related transcriptional regulator [Candidatus Baltobacteraceae bacterium]
MQNSETMRSGVDRQRLHESIRARLRVAMELAISRHVHGARAALGELRTVVDFGDAEMVARYHLTLALTLLKERSIDEAFVTFEGALEAARRCGDAALIAGVLTNYGTAAMQDGSVNTAVACLEERQRILPSGERSFIGLLGLAEALYTAGALERAAEMLHALYERYADSVTLLGAAAIGIPLGLMLGDEVLVTKSHDHALPDLAFSRGEQWLIGPLAESFCLLYEHEGLRAEHDELLRCSLERLTSLDNSLALAVRAARTGNARDVPRIGKLVACEYSTTSNLQAARRDWYDAAVAARHGQRATSRKLGARSAASFGRAGRPLLQATVLELAGLSSEARTILLNCGARASPRIRWKAPPIRHRSTELTPREFEVARLAAKGLANRAIAETLQVSERTVHRHCESIFGKLGIHSRWQLSATGFERTSVVG